MLCAGIIGYRSLKVAGIHPQEVVAMVGFGASAHLAIQVLRFWNCRIFVFTRSDMHRNLAIKLGAEWAGGIEEKAPCLVDCAVSFAPSGDLIPALLPKIRSGGCLAVNAVYASQVPAFPYQLLYGERKIVSVANATREDGSEFMRLAQKIGIQSTVRKYPLADANTALLDLKNGRIEGQAILQLAWSA
jgi:propanol-preferring alcohol dehydrogenase